MTEIRTLTAPDIAPAAAALQRGAWGERTAILRWAFAEPTWHPYVAVARADIVGTGIAIAHGAVGWVGLIWTAPEARGRGIGTAVTAHVIADLEARGCPTQVLIATAQGRPVYERLGFRAVAGEVVLGPGAGSAATLSAAGGVAVRPFVAADLAAVLALDAQATGEDRAAMLAAARGGLVVADGGRGLRAFRLEAPFGGFGTVAPWEPSHCFGNFSFATG